MVSLYVAALQILGLGLVLLFARAQERQIQRLRRELDEERERHLQDLEANAAWRRRRLIVVQARRKQDTDSYELLLNDGRTVELTHGMRESVRT